MSCIGRISRRYDRSTSGRSEPSSRSSNERAIWRCSIWPSTASCDVVAIKVEDIAPNGYSVDRATVRQKKTGRPVRFELTEQTRQTVDGYIRAAGKKPGEFLFSAPRGALSYALVRLCERDLQVVSNRIDFGEIDAPVDESVAVGTNTAEVP